MAFSKVGKATVGTCLAAPCEPSSENRAYPTSTTSETEKADAQRRTGPRLFDLEGFSMRRYTRVGAIVHLARAK